jgi:hypothetical protein
VAANISLPTQIRELTRGIRIVETWISCFYM